MILFNHNRSSIINLTRNAIIDIFTSVNKPLSNPTSRHLPTKKFPDIPVKTKFPDFPVSGKPANSLKYICAINYLNTKKFHKIIAKKVNLAKCPQAVCKTLCSQSVSIAYDYKHIHALMYNRKTKCFQQLIACK